MNRKAKFALSTVVLAGLVGGTAAWASPGSAVKLEVDGQTRQVHTRATTVGQALEALKVPVSSHDIVAPVADTKLDGVRAIVVRHAHELHLVVDGTARDVWVQASSLGEALDQMGFANQSRTSVSRSTRVADQSAAVDVRTPKAVSIQVDGHSTDVISFGLKVSDAVADGGVQLKPGDTTSTPLDSPLTSGLVLVVNRAPVPAPAAAPAPKPAAKPAPAPAPAPVASQSAAEARQIGAEMVAARGWSSDEFGCLDRLFSKESGWRTNAHNGSGAYGIPQALPGSKMAKNGADWQTNARTQIAWGLDYIAGRYGTPCRAWAHSQATNWY